MFRCIILRFRKTPVGYQLLHAVELHISFLSIHTGKLTPLIFIIYHVSSGSPSVRTHCVNRVSNQRSLFHISAGLDKVESGQKEKSTSQIASSNQSTSPRLPPFPHPTFGQPVVQIKQVDF